MNFRTIFRSLALLVLLVGAGGLKQAAASHYAAVDINAKYAGVDSTNLKYRVSLTVYVACGGAPISLSETIHWGYDSTDAQGIPVVDAKGNPYIIEVNDTTIDDDDNTVDTLDQLCPNFSSVNSCRTANTPYPGYTRVVASCFITLPKARPYWRFWWTSGARSGSIVNLDINAPSPPGPPFFTYSNIYVECGLDNTGSFWGNSTPQYLTAPNKYMCVNQQNKFVNTPKDIDNDSMFTSNLNPRGNLPFAPIPYLAGHSLANPFGSPGPNPYILNSSSAESKFTPTNTGQYVLGFLTEAYDPITKKRTGYTTRDVQFAVLPCAAPPPAIDSVPYNLNNGGVIPGNIISICPNFQTTFDVRSSSLSNSNYVLLTSDNVTQAPGSNFQVDTNSSVTTGRFSWTPTTGDIGDFNVTFYTRDTTCNPAQPILLDNSLTVTIRVRPGLDAGPDLKICPLGDYAVQLFVNGPADKAYQWTALDGSPAQYISNPNIQNPTANPPVDYTYVVYSDDPDFVCKKRDTVTVSVDRSNGVNVIQDPIVVCRPSYIAIGADSIGQGPVANLPCGPYNTLTCPTPDVITVGNTGNTGVIKMNTPFYSNYQYTKYQFIIPKSELKNAGLYSGTLSSIAFLSNNALLGSAPLANLRVSLGCTNQLTYPTAPSNNSFIPATTLVATVASYTITPNAWNVITFDQRYNWDTTQNLVVDICMGQLATPNTNGLDPVDMTVGAAIQRFSNTIDVCSANALDTAVARYNQRPIVQFQYCSAPTLPYDWNWTPGTNLADSTIKYTTAYVDQSINYAIETRGRNGCLQRDSLHIIVPVYTLTIDPADTAVCVNQPVPLHATGAQGYIWYENGFNTPTTLSCNDCADPIATPNTPGQTVYTVVYLNPDNCYDTLKQTITVYALPDVRIVNRDTTIKYGQSVELYVNGANQYTWTPVGSLNDPNIPNPIASPTQTTSYVVFGKDRNQCSNTDTIRVTVDFRGNLLIPTGFTPNLDGRNDYFKVVNVTFQRLMEFRVFNRWGQEVFSTTDVNKGWDGKWRGVDQDMGTYKYVIRVAYPDGIVDTYKGDVTLIR